MAQELIEENPNPITEIRVKREFTKKEGIEI